MTIFFLILLCFNERHRRMYYALQRELRKGHDGYCSWDLLPSGFGEFKVTSHLGKHGVFKIHKADASFSVFNNSGYEYKCSNLEEAAMLFSKEYYMQRALRKTTSQLILLGLYQKVKRLEKKPSKPTSSEHIKAYRKSLIASIKELDG